MRQLRFTKSVAGSLALFCALDGRTATAQSGISSELRTAQALAAQEKFEEAYQVASGFCRTVAESNVVLRFTCLITMGKYAEDLRRFPESLGYINQAVQIIRELPNQRQNLAFALLLAGRVRRRTDEWPVGIRNLDEAATLFSEAGDIADVYEATGELTALHLEHNDPGAAVETSRALLQAAISIGDPRKEANANFFVAESLKNLGRAEEAFEPARRALVQISATAPGSADHLRVLHTMSVILARLGRDDEALASYEQTRALAATLKDATEESGDLYNIGRLLLSRGQSKEALAKLREALDVARRTNTPFPNNALIGVHSEIAMALMAQGEVLEAWRAFQQSLSLLSGREDAEVELWANLSKLHEEYGDYVKSAEVLRQAVTSLESSSKVGLPSRTALWMAVGDAYIQLREPVAAEEALHRALDGATPDELLTLRANLCDVSMIVTKEYERALTCYREILPLYADRTSGKATSVKVNHGTALEFTHRYGEAEEMFRKLVADSHARSDGDEEALAWLGLSRVLEKQDRLVEAATAAENAQALTNKYNISVPEQLGRVYWRLGRRKEGLALLKLALTNAERRRHETIGMQSRVADFAWYASVPTTLAQLYAEAALSTDGTLEPDLYESSDGIAGTALYYWEHTRARVLNDVLPTTRTPRRDPSDDRLWMRSDAAAQGGTTALATSALAQAYRDLFYNMTAIARAEGRTPPALGYSDPIRPSSASLAPDETLLEYAVYDNETFVWLVRASERVTVRRIAISRTVLEDKVADVMRCVRGDFCEPYDALEDLYDRLLKPELERVKCAQCRLLIVADDVLATMPFEILGELRSDGWRYVSQHATIRYSASMSSLAVQQSVSRQNAFRLPPKRLLAIGDPRRTGAPVDLPGAAAEIDVVATSLGVDPGGPDVVSGDRATEDWLGQASTSGALAQYQIVHFATHGVVDAQAVSYPIPEPALLLATTASQSTDGLLRASEVTALRLRADLVVLSACETGRGTLAPGEGVLSLARAFLVAGARTTIVSLWKVDDHSTAQFMKALYERIQRGTDIPEALRATRQSMSDAGVRPFVWAAFVLVAA